MLRTLVHILLLVGLYRAAFAEPSIPWRPAGVVISAAVATNGEPIRLPVLLGGRTLWFMVDTCARVTVVSSRSIDDIQRLGVQTAPITGGTGSFEVCSLSGMRVANVDCDWVRHAVVIDLSHIARDVGMPIDGILGRDFLSQFVFHLDLDNGILLLCNPLNVDTPPGSKLPLKFSERGHPCIHAEFGPTNVVTFLIDTGSLGGVEIDKSIAARLQDQPGFVSTGLWTRTKDILANSTETELIRFNELFLGQHKTRSVVLSLGNSNSLGLYFLCRYRLTLDFNRHASYWQASNRFSLADRGDCWGLANNTDSDGSKVIAYVSGNSLAARCGLRVGDRIVSANGTPLTELTKPEWRRLSTFPTEKEIELVIERGATKQTIHIPGG